VPSGEVAPSPSGRSEAKEAPPPSRQAPVEPAAPAADETDAATAADSGSLFKRMSAALQRAMLGQTKDESPHDE